MNPFLLTLLTFLAVVLAIVGAYSILTDLYLRDRNRMSQRMEEEFRLKQRASAQGSHLIRSLGKVGKPVVDLNAPLGPWQRYQLLVEQSGLEITAVKLLVLSLLAGLAVGTVAGIVLGNLAAGAGLAVVVAAAPLWYVRRRRQQRQETMLKQLPDALDLIARVIRAGQSMAQSMRAVADEFQGPLAAEFAYCYEQQDLGLAPEVALQDMARRTGLLEIKIFIMALLVQKQTGGNLAAILENLATVVRGRFRVRDKIRVLTAEGRLQAVVLLALPPLMLLVMLFLNPNYTGVLLEHPYYLAGAVLSMAFGSWWIRRIVNFKF